MDEGKGERETKGKGGVRGLRKRTRKGKVLRQYLIRKRGSGKQRLRELVGRYTKRKGRQAEKRSREGIC